MQCSGFVLNFLPVFSPQDIKIISALQQWSKTMIFKVSFYIITGFTQKLIQMKTWAESLGHIEIETLELGHSGDSCVLWTLNNELYEPEVTNASFLLKLSMELCASRNIHSQTHINLSRFWTNTSPGNSIVMLKAMTGTLTEEGYHWLSITAHLWTPPAVGQWFVSCHSYSNKTLIGQ